MKKVVWYNSTMSKRVRTEAQKKAIAERQKVYYEENKEKLREYGRQYYLDHQEQQDETKRRYIEEHREENLAWQREYHKKNATKKNEHRRAKKHGLSPEDIQHMSLDQRGRCAVCGCIPDKGLVIDHNHATGKVRALLCHQCNTALGLMKEDLARFQSAMEYLKKWNSP
jgi:hypothetical protein